MRLPIGLQSYPIDSPVTAERLINCYAEQAPATARTQVFVRKIPGVAIWPTTGTLPASDATTAAGIEWQGALYWVAAGGFYRTTTNGATTLLGSIGAGPYTFAPLRSSLTVCDGAKAWNYDPSDGTPFAETTAVTTVGVPSFTGCKFVTHSRQRVIFADTVTDQFAWSDVGDARTITGTNSKTAEALEDDLVSAATLSDELVLFGGESIELYYDTGGTSDTFQRRGPSHIARGCVAPQSVAVESNAVFFLGDDRIVYALDGLTPRRISTHGLETWMRTRTVSDATGFFHTWNGHKFYTLTFPSESRTFVFDLMTELWHERRSWNLGRWRPAFAVEWQGQTFMGDAFSRNLLILDPAIETAAEAISDWEIWLAPVQDNTNRHRLFHDRIEAEFDAGTAPLLGDAATPEVMLDISSDGGRTFHTTLTRDLGTGPVGQYSWRTAWHGLGADYSRTYRFRGTDAYPMRLFNVFANIRAGTG